MYSDWTGRVKKNGVEMPGHVNVTPNRVLNNDNNLMQFLSHYKNKTGQPGNLDEPSWRCHCVLGDLESGIIIGLYKSMPCFVFLVDDFTIRRVDPWEDDDAHFSWYGRKKMDLVFNGITVYFRLKQDPERILCQFTDPNGNQWVCSCGLNL